ILRIAAPRLDRPMLGRVPAPQREVDAAAIRDAVVDHDELLVVRGAHRQMGVEPDLGATALTPSEDETREQLAPGRLEQRVVPEHDRHFELVLAAQQELEQPAELARRAVAAVALAHEARATVELPSQDEDRTFGLEQRGPQRAEVIRGIDERS